MLKRDSPTRKNVLTWFYWLEVYHPSCGTMHTFDVMHRTQITHETAAKFIKKFKKTGSAADETTSRRSKMATYGDVSTHVLGKMATL